MQVYTQTNEATEKENVFYYELSCSILICETPKHDIVILLGDLYAKVGDSRKDIEEVVKPFTTTEKTCNITAGKYHYPT